MKPYDLGYRFRRIHEGFRSAGNARGRKFDLTRAQMDILHYMFKKGESATQRELEKHFDLKHSTVIGILKRMEKNGFIEISVCESDRRQRSVKLLQKAYDVQKDCKTHRDYMENKFKKGLTKEELSTLEYLLDKVYDILKEDTENN